MNGRILFAIVFVSLLGGFFFLLTETGEGGLIDGLSSVDRLFLGSFFIFLIGCVIGGAAVMLVGAWRVARGRHGAGNG